MTKDRIVSAVVLVLFAVIVGLTTYIVASSYAQPPWAALAYAAGAFIAVTTVGAALLAFVMGGK